MKLPDGFTVRCVASEPMIRQPVSISFDDRGRLWVLQYLQYPNPAGLKPVKQDQYLRTIWDRVPEPPPHGPKGARPAHHLLRPGRERRLPQVEGLRHRAEHRQRVLPRQRRRVRRPAAVPALLPGQGPGRRSRRRPGGAAHRVRHGRHALARQLAAVGAGRLALRRRRQHQHLQDQEPGRPEGRAGRVPAGHLAVPPEDEEVRAVQRGRRQHLRPRLRQARAGDRRARTGAASRCCTRCRGRTTSRGSPSTARCTTRTPTATSTTSRTRASRAGTSPAAASSTRPTRTRRSSATSTSPANLLSNAVYWHKLEPDGVDVQGEPRRRPDGGERHVVPAGRLHPRAGRVRVRRRLVRHAGPPTSTRSTTGTRPTAASTASSTRATPKYPDVRPAEEVARGAGRAAEAPEQVVAERGPAAARRAAGHERRTRRCGSWSMTEKGDARARSAVGAVRLRRVDDEYATRAAVGRTRTSTSGRGTSGSSATTPARP